jgi:hypothetical protein
LHRVGEMYVYIMCPGAIFWKRSKHSVHFHIPSFKFIVWLYTHTHPHTQTGKWVLDCILQLELRVLIRNERPQGICRAFIFPQPKITLNCMNTGCSRAFCFWTFNEYVKEVHIWLYHAIE